MIFLAVGFLLPASWQASATRNLDASPEEIFVYLDSPEGWRRWTTWPDGELGREGPERGGGSSLSWDDPEIGSGSFTILGSVPPLRLDYAVAFGQSMEARGSVFLAAQGETTGVAWEESGDLGRNPLMGYWALFMGAGQSEEMEKGLERLAVVVDSARARPRTPKGSAPSGPDPSS